MEFKCQRCGEVYTEDCKVCPYCLVPIPQNIPRPEQDEVWPPHATSTRVLRIAGTRADTVDDFVRYGRAFTWLSALLTPAMFFPFAIYYGIAAIRYGELGKGWTVTASATLILLLYAGAYVILCKP